MQTILNTDFSFTGQTSVYNGKVRDVYFLENDKLVMIASDRISAFDVILPKGIPFKGQVLNQIAAKFLKETASIIPNWLLSTPDPSAAIGYKCEPFKVEMVIRAYLTGHAWREYKEGKRELCGVALPDGMKEHQKFEQPIITPSTKADVGDKDMDISKEDILSKGIVSAEDYAVLEKATYALFEKGTEMAADKGLILVDTKYEFGSVNGEIRLIDEIHTPDSSRYFYADTYQSNFDQDLPQKQLSKEFVREWLIENGFQGKPGQVVPEMTPAVVQSISERYIELYETITGEKFVPADTTDIHKRIENNVEKALK